MKSKKTAWKRCLAAGMAACMLAVVPVNPVHAVGAGSAIAKGIDVSKHNLAIDWSQVPGAGISFAFVKAGSTNSGVDPYFDANIQGANAAGLRTGVYLYSYAANVEQAQNEANQLLQWIGNYTVSYPVVYDVEAACHKNMSQEQLQAIINTFCSTIEAAGYYPVVYSYKNMFQNKIGNVPYDKWVAQYADALEYDGASFWQSTSHGSIAGIPTRVDINYQFKDYSSLIVANGFSKRGDNQVFYSNYKMQRSCWVSLEDKKYHVDENGFVQKGCWFEDETGRYFLANDRFRGSSAHSHDYIVEKPRTGIIAVVVVGARHRVSARHSSRNNGNFVNGVAIRHKLCDYRMPRFVVSRNALVRFRYEAALFLRP